MPDNSPSEPPEEARLQEMLLAELRVQSERLRIAAEALTQSLAEQMQAQVLPTDAMPANADHHDPAQDRQKNASGNGNGRAQADDTASTMRLRHTQKTD